MKMTRLEHAAEAERLLERVTRIIDDSQDAGQSSLAAALQAITQLTARAQVHATLATITADTTPRPFRSNL